MFYLSESRFWRAKRIIVLILIILVGLGAGGFFVYKNISVPEEETEEIPPVVEEKLEEEEIIEEEEEVRPVKCGKFECGEKGVHFEDS